MPAARSSSGRFVAVGGGAVECMRAAAWAEDAAEGLERVVGVQLRAARNRMFRVVLGGPAANATRGVNYEQCRNSTGLLQALYAASPDALEAQETLASFARLALTQMACDAAPTHAAPDTISPTEVPDVPQWLSDGVAGCMKTGERSRARKAMVRARKPGDAVSLEEVLDSGPGRRPADAQRLKSAAVLAVMWIRAQPDSGAAFNAILARVRSGRPVTPAWLAAEVFRIKPEQAEAAWRAWLKRQGGVVDDLGTMSSEAMDAVRARLEISRGEDGVPADRDLPQRVETAELIARRAEPWVPAASRRRIAELRAACAGRAPEICDAAERYVEFFGALARGASADVLTGLLRHADMVFGELDALVRAREAYLDAVERRVREQAALEGGGR